MKVYEVSVCNIEGEKIDTLYFNSYKAAKLFKPYSGHVSCIGEFPLFTSKDIISGNVI